MPNWCYTTYRLEGKQEDIEALDQVMEELEDLEKPLVKSDFGNEWLGCLVTKLGEDWNKVGCRGSWINRCLMPDGTLSFETETAWSPAEEVIALIQEKYPGIENVWYYSEEPGMGFYETNDAEGRFWKDRYVLCDHVSGEEEVTQTLEEALDIVARWRGWRYNSLEEAEKDEELFIQQIDIV